MYLPKRWAALALAAALCAAACGCAKSETTSGSAASFTNAADEAGTEETADAVTTAATATSALRAEYTDRDLSGEWSGETAVTIRCSGSGAEVSGAGASVTDGTLLISAEGVYVLSGSFNGCIVVEAGDADKVQLVLNGLSVTATDGPALWVRAADKVFLTLAEGTENSVADAAAYTLDAGEDEPNACVYSKADLVINGNGALRVTGNYRHGINSKDDFKMTGGSVTVTAVEDGVRGKDCIGVCGGTLTVTAGCDGLHSDNSEDAARGYISLTGGTLAITAGEDGAQAQTTLLVDGAEVTVTSGGGSGEAAAATAEGFGRQAQAVQTTADTTSAKGLKAGTFLEVASGSVTADCADDALHTNGSMALQGGALTLKSGDDGVHADAALTISGGSVTVAQSYEGLEASQILISGGSVWVTASDDGLNAAGGNDGSGFGGGFGQDSFATSTEGASSLEISGGTLVVDAGGDGLDSNGTLTVSGGVTLVSGPTDGANGALDTGTSATIAGGVVVAAGSTAMAVNFDSSSTQCSWLADTGSQAAGTALALLDGAGEVLLSWTPAKAYSCVVVSTPAMTQGESYTLWCGGTVDGADENGYAEGGALTGGRQAAAVTMSEMSVSDVSGMGGGMAMGGRGGKTMDGAAEGTEGFGGRGGMGGQRADGAAPTDGTAPAGDAPPTDGAAPTTDGGDAQLPDSPPGGEV